MENEEIAVKITALEHESKSAKHRIDDLEVQNQAIQDLALAVKELTINMGNMLEEQRRQGIDIDKLKAEPAKQWSATKKTFFTSITSSIGTAVAAGILYLLSRGGF